jgi:hypothetical protein
MEHIKVNNIVGTWERENNENEAQCIPWVAEFEISIDFLH